MEVSTTHCRIPRLQRSVSLHDRVRCLVRPKDAMNEEDLEAVDDVSSLSNTLHCCTPVNSDEYLTPTQRANSSSDVWRRFLRSRKRTFAGRILRSSAWPENWSNCGSSTTGVKNRRRRCRCQPRIHSIVGWFRTLRRFGSLEPNHTAVRYFWFDVCFVHFNTPIFSGFELMLEI